MIDQSIIVGAGLAGLIAAHAFPSYPIVETAPEPRQMHRALLRFRSDAVARMTGVEFRKVRVHKGIWFDNAYRQPDIFLANMYAQKVTGSVSGDRSIWKTESVDRFIAPDTFYEQLLEGVAGRASWNTSHNFGDKWFKCISTAPLPVTLRALQIAAPENFDRAPITVMRCEVPRADVFQTVYFPGSESPMYRASITGATLIIESMSTAEDGWEMDAINLCFRAFGIDQIDVIDTVEQKYGKIKPLKDEARRKQLLFQLTHDHKIFSLGRFATWRNILLDDVVDDIAVIKRLMRGDSYELRKAAG